MNATGPTGSRSRGMALALCLILKDDKEPSSRP